MLTVTWNIHADLRARFNHSRAFRKLMPDAIDLDVNEWKVLSHFLCFYEIPHLALRVLLSPRERIEVRASGALSGSCSSSKRIEHDYEQEHEEKNPHQIVPAAPAFSQPGSCASGTVEIFPLAISSSGVYSGGNGGGADFVARAAKSSGNFSTKLSVGQAQASPKAQMVRPAMLSATVFRVAGSCITPPPSSIRSVIFFIQRAPSRQGVHCPHDSWA